DLFHLYHLCHDGTGSPCRDGIAAHPVSVLPSRTANRRLETPFLHHPADQPVSTQRGLCPLLLRFHSTSARPATRIGFVPTPSNNPSTPAHGACQLRGQCQTSTLTKRALRW